MATILRSLQKDILKFKEENENKPTLSTKWVIQKMNNMYYKALNELQMCKFQPDVYRRGDVVMGAVGLTLHPCILIKKYGDDWLALGLSSQVNHAIEPITKSRIYKGYYTYSIIKLTSEEVTKLYIGRFDNIKEFNKVMKTVKTFYSKL